MFPEKLSMRLIQLVADKIDKNRRGVAIEIGVGTSNFYSEIYKSLEFKTIAVDPIPFPPFVELSLEKDIIYDESCIYKNNGPLTLYISALSDLSSLHSNWWGVKQSNSKTVIGQTFSSFIEKHQIERITFLKIDTEGSELEIIQQLSSSNNDLLPEVLEFEYGGGCSKSEGHGGWSPEFYSKLLKIIELLKQMGYSQGIILDSIDLEPNVFTFESISNPDTIFKPYFEYGNLVAFKKPINNLESIKVKILEEQNIYLKNYIDTLKKENRSLSTNLLRKDYIQRIKNKFNHLLNK